MTIDPYLDWLRIPPDRRPPTHYDLLGLPLFEPDDERARSAATQRMAHVRKYQLGAHSDLAIRLMGEISRAMTCLTDPAARQAYDAQLRTSTSPRQATHAPRAAAASAPPLRPVAIGNGAAQPPASTAPLGKIQLGMRLGSFEIQRKLGAGAMGEVWLAHDLYLDRDVAIKVLPSDFAQGPGRLQRFVREAQAAGKLEHANIVTVYQSGVEQGVAFIAMQYIDGGSLDAVVKPGQPMPWREATQVILDAARGLAAAHQKDFVHRDIKPSNLMRTADGTTKVVDFGLTRQQNSDSNLTAHGVLLGTPDYMAPELWTFETADARSDVYALACTYYYLLTGQTPFGGTNFDVLKYQHRHTPCPDPRLIAADIPAAVLGILTRGTAKAASDRYPSASDMAAELKGVLESAGQPIAKAVPILAPETRMPVIIERTRPVPRQSRRRRGPPSWTWPAAAVLALLLGVIVYINTRAGLVKIDLKDPATSVSIKIDGDTIDIAGLDQPLSFKVGPHELEASSPGFKTLTKSFTAKRGETVLVEVTLVPVLGQTPPPPPPERLTVPANVQPVEVEPSPEVMPPVIDTPRATAPPAGAPIADGASRTSSEPLQVVARLGRATKVGGFTAAAVRMPYVYALDRVPNSSTQADLVIFKIPPEFLAGLASDELFEIGRMPNAGEQRHMVIVGENLLTTRGGGFEVYSLADPEHPRHMPLANVQRAQPDPRRNVQAILLHQQYGYLVCEDRLVITDLKSPASPRELATMFTRDVRSDGSLWSGCIVGRHLYLSRNKLFTEKNSAIEVYDLSNPSQPQRVGEVPCQTKDAIYHLCPVPPDRLIATSTGSAQLYSLAKPAAPAPLFQPVSTRGRHALIYPKGNETLLVTGGQFWRVTPTGLQEAGTYPSASGWANGFPYHGASDGVFVAIPSEDEIMVLAAPQPVKTTNAAAADRAAAEFVVQRLQGSVRVRVGQNDFDVGANQDLPAGDLRLTEIHLYDRREVTDSHVAQFANLEHLEHFSLGFTSVTDKGMASLQNLKTLKYLEIAGIQVTDLGIRHLKGLTNLETVRAYILPISDQALAHLKDLPNLRFLEVRSTSVSDVGMELIAKHKNLETLMIGETPVTAKGLQAIGQLKRLKVLAIGHIQCSDANLRLIATLPAIEELYFNDCPLHDENVKLLFPLKKLRTINIDNTGLSAKGVAAIRANWPGCKIEGVPRN